MAVYLGEKLKQFRRMRDLTQEQVADIFHVSPQAVSRWETGVSLPDVEMLPPIAAFFKVTVDDLLGVDVLRDKERINEIFREIKDLNSKGLADEQITLLRNAVREFPNHHGLLHELANTLVYKGHICGDDGELRKHKKEAVSINERILAECTEDRLRYSVLTSLSRDYESLGEHEKAVETAKKLPEAYYTMNAALELLYRGEDLLKQLAANVGLYASLLCGSANTLSLFKYPDDAEKRIKIYKKIVAFYELLYEDGYYGFNHFHLKYCYMKLAVNYMTVNDVENALGCIEKAARHVVTLDTTPYLTHTSLLFAGEAYDAKEIMKGYSSNESYCFLHGDGNETLHDARFDPIRNSGRFKAVTAELERHAKEIG